MAGETPFFSKLVKVGNRAKQPLARAVVRTPFGKAIKNLRPNTAGTVQEVKTSEFTGGQTPTVDAIARQPGVLDMGWGGAQGGYVQESVQQNQLQERQTEKTPGQGNESQQSSADVLRNRILRWLTRGDKRPPQQLADIATGEHLGADADSVAASGAEQNGTSPTLKADISRPDLGAINDRLDAAVQPVAERKAGEEAYATWQGVESDLRAKLKARVEKDPSRALSEDDINTLVQRRQERNANKYVRDNLEANNRGAVETFLGGSNLDPVFVDQARMAIQKYDVKNAPRTGDSLPGINTTTRVYVERQWQNVGDAAREAYTTRVTRKGGNPEDAKTASNMSRSVDRAQRRAVREYVTKSLDSNNRQALDKLLAEGKLDATLASQLQDAITQYDAQHVKKTDAIQPADTTDTADTTVDSKTDDKDAASDTADVAQETQAEEASEEQILEEMSAELNKRVKRKDREKTPDELKKLGKAAREFATFSSKGDTEVVRTITRAKRLAEIREKLQVAQEEQRIWNIVLQAKTSERIQQLIDDNLVDTRAAIGDIKKVEALEHARENLQKAKEMAKEKNIDAMTDEDRQQETARITGEVTNLAKREKTVAELYAEGMKTFEKKNRSPFYGVLANLPKTFQENPELAKQLVELYKDGKKKKLKGIFLGTLLLVGTVVVGDLIQNGSMFMPDNMSGR